MKSNYLNERLQCYKTIDCSTLICTSGQCPRLNLIPKSPRIKCLKKSTNSRTVKIKQNHLVLCRQVDYDNHPHFTSKGKKGGKRGSPVRIFTNISAAKFVLPKHEGYRYNDNTRLIQLFYSYT